MCREGLGTRLFPAMGLKEIKVMLFHWWGYQLSSIVKKVIREIYLPVEVLATGIKIFGWQKLHMITSQALNHLITVVQKTNYVAAPTPSHLKDVDCLIPYNHGWKCFTGTQLSLGIEGVSIWLCSFYIACRYDANP